MMVKLKIKITIGLKTEIKYYIFPDETTYKLINVCYFIILLRSSIM